MTTPLLDMRRANADPKCANCREWDGRDTGKSAALCQRHKMPTTDLAVCTAWEEHEVLTGRVFKPGEAMPVE